ncbi:MAG: aspartate/glutamate racemase family protein [Bavariicoccus seileri]|uniref:Amino acid racemase n=1 Tax=Bavariicoccus seileri TaxID=549685 RepID=A0A3D4S6H7_9ENTE|nr:amino acid racemase [Bavariicoccus seileri]HCS93561.1 amino acid racemase [Bavariicoccus seileri]
MKHFFAILGGMGTLATTNFLVELNRHFHPDSDQAYFDYLLVNHATIPDRTDYILDHSNPNPAEALLEDIKQITPLRPDFFVMPCNTAHYFFDELQQATDIPLVSMLTLVADELKRTLPAGAKVGLFATKGTVRSKLYADLVTKAGFEIVEPSEDLQQAITSLIYDDVKEHSQANLKLYEEILEEFKALSVATTILGCTEVSYVNSHDPIRQYPIIDAEKLLVKETIRLAHITQKK